MARFSSGWVKLYRKAIFEDIGDDGVVLSVWVTLLCWANYKEGKEKLGRQQIILQPGMISTGTTELCERLKFPRTTIYRALQYLEKTERISITSGTQGSVITICNWSEYQLCDEGRETQVEHGWNTPGTHQEHTRHNSKEVPSVLKKEEERIKNNNVGIRIEYPEEFDTLWLLYCRKGDKKAAFIEYKKLNLDNGQHETLSIAIQNYFKSQSDPKFRKDFERFLKTDWREWLTPKNITNGIHPKTQQRLDLFERLKAREETKAVALAKEVENESH